MNPQPAPERAQIFISYAREDRVQADAIASALRRRGWAVWWDPKIRLGTSYQSAIEEALDASRCVVVLWSAHARASQWVKEEAQSGLDRDILIPVLVENVQAPLGFRSLQAAELSGWNGDENHPEFQKLVEHVEALLGPGAEPTRQPETERGGVAPPSPRPPHRAPGEPPAPSDSVWTPRYFPPAPPTPATLSPRAPSRAEERPDTLGILGRLVFVGGLLLAFAVLPGIAGMCLIGLIAGAIAVLFLPRRNRGGTIITLLLGLAGSLLGGLLFGGSDGRVGVIGSVLGALILVFVYRLLIARRMAA